MLEQYLFAGVFIGGLLALVLTFANRRKKGFALELLVSVALIAAGTFGPTLFNSPPTPFVLFPALSFTDSDDAASDAAVDSVPSLASSITSSRGSVKVVDSDSGAPVAGAEVVAKDVVADVLVSEKTDVVGIVPIPVLIAKIDRKLQESGKVSTGEKREITLITTVGSESKEQDIVIDDTAPKPAEFVDVEVDVLPPLSQSFLEGSRVESIASTQEQFSSSVLIPIISSETMAPPSFFGGLSGGFVFERRVYTADLVVNGRIEPVSTIRIVMTYRGDEQIENFYVEEDLRDLLERYAEWRRGQGAGDPRVLEEAENIQVIGVEPQPVELKQGQVVGWLFSNIKPGDEVEVSYTINTAVDENVVKKVSAPEARKLSDEPLRIVVKNELGSFNFATLVGLVLASGIVLAIAFFFMRRK